VTCPEDRLIAFLAGDLPAEEERAFDEHLLGCEQCWRAVQADQAARAALRTLRQPAPSGLQDRVALAVTVASDRSAPSPAGAGRPRLRALRGHPGRRPVNAGRPVRHPLAVRLSAAAVVVALGAAAAGWYLAGGGTGRDAPQVDAVVAMMTPGATPPGP
jgi:anti-sigma factor RsiW